MKHLQTWTSPRVWLFDTKKHVMKQGKEILNWEQLLIQRDLLSLFVCRAQCCLEKSKILSKGNSFSNGGNEAKI